MSKPFRTLVRVRYAECDAQLVVFNARYGDFVDLAITEYVRVLFGSYQQVMDQGYDYQVVRLSTDYKSPAKFDDVLSISVDVAKLGNTSFSFLLEFREFYSDRLVATSEIVYVMMSCPEYEKVSIPDFFRQKLTQGAPDQILNYAGIDL
jgi:acyl-CoA thioester hydrolase